MRADMDKILCERPRRGSVTRKYGRAMEDVENIPAKKHDKSLNENLQPLYRFLRSRLGRPWDKVYSEIREHFDKSSAVKLHIFQHLSTMVEQNAVYRNGKYYEPISYSRKSTTPEVSGFYIDRMGILREAIQERYRWKLKELPKNPNIVKIDAYSYLLRMNGSWFIGQFRDLPSEQTRKREYVIGDRVRTWNERYTPPFTDVFLKKADAQTCIREYGGRVYCYEMKQLGKREIRRYRKVLGFV